MPLNHGAVQGAEGGILCLCFSKAGSACQSLVCVSDLLLLGFLGLKVEPAALHEFVAVADRPGRGALLFPEICAMELQLLASGSPDLEVLSHVFHSLLSAVHANHHNAALLYDQVPPTTVSSLCYT